MVVKDPDLVLGGKTHPGSSSNHWKLVSSYEKIKVVPQFSQPSMVTALSADLPRAEEFELERMASSI